MSCELVPKIINFPQDWIKAVDKRRGDVPFGEYVRECVRLHTDERLEQPQGRGRPKK